MSGTGFVLLWAAAIFFVFKFSDNPLVYAFAIAWGIVASLDQIWYTVELLQIKREFDAIEAPPPKSLTKKAIFGNAVLSIISVVLTAVIAFLLWRLMRVSIG